MVYGQTLRVQTPATGNKETSRVHAHGRHRGVYWERHTRAFSTYGMTEVGFTVGGGFWQALEKLLITRSVVRVHVAELQTRPWYPVWDQGLLA